MHRLTRLTLRICFTATILALTAAASASANRLSTSQQRFDMTWTNLTFEAAGNTLSCPLTLEGSFHTPTITKVANSLIGHVTRASIRGGSGAGECTGGRFTVLTGTLPWHVTYLRFAGRLPAIERIYILLIGFALQIQPTGSLTCLMRSTTTNPMIFWVELTAEGTIRNINADIEAEIPLTGSFGLCPFAGEVHFAGTGAANHLGDNDPIVIRLI